MNELSQELLKRLDLLAAKLGTTGQYLWGVLIKQAKVEAISAVVIAVTCLLLAVVAAYVVKRLHAYGNSIPIGNGGTLHAFQERDRRQGVRFGEWSLGTVAAILSIMAVSQFVQAASVLINPEYWALQQVIGAFK